MPIKDEDMNENENFTILGYTWQWIYEESI